MKTNLLIVLTALLFHCKITAQEYLFIKPAESYAYSDEYLADKFMVSEPLPGDKKDIAVFQIRLMHPETVRVRIFNFNGDLVKENSYLPEKESMLVDIDTGNLATGFYFVQFYTLHGSGVRKLLKK